jgi:hypothetical protein
MSGVQGGGTGQRATLEKDSSVGLATSSRDNRPTITQFAPLYKNLTSHSKRRTVTLSLRQDADQIHRSGYSIRILGFDYHTHVNNVHYFKSVTLFTTILHKGMLFAVVNRLPPSISARCSVKRGES